MTARRVRSSWFVLFTIAWLVIWTAQLTPVQLLLPLQLDTPDDADGWIGGVVSSGVILGIGGFAGIIAGPLTGAISDRSRSRWGRRRPYAIGGSLLGAGCLLLTGAATGPVAVGAAWVGVSVGIAVASAAFTAVIADQLDANQRGAASAAVGSAQAVGIVVGVGAVILLGLGVMDGYAVLALLFGAGGTSTALLLPDPPAPAALRATGLPGRRFASLRDRDFALMLGGRLTVNIGNALGTTLLLFFLIYGLGQDATLAEDRLLVLIVVYTVFVVIASVVCGRISDRTGRRRGMTVIAALVQALAAAVICVFPTYEITLVAGAMLGVGYGAFTAVGLAFATDLLPSPTDNARDLGIVNVSANLGQLLGPLAGAALIAAFGGFWVVFLGAAVFSVVGALLTMVVRERAPGSQGLNVRDGSGRRRQTPGR